MPAAEVDVDDDLVRALLAEQHPDLAELPLTLVASGWDNVLYRLGDELSVRLPRRALAAPLIEQEQRWLPELAPILPLPVPVPIRTGAPSDDYPWRWSICRWLDGATALESTIDDFDAAAISLGAFGRALHVPAPEDAPINGWFRGVDLALRDDAVQERINQLGTTIDAATVRARWAEFVAVPAWSAPPVWLHGDTHPGNILVNDGAVSAIIDFGDLTKGDPATDIAIAWMLLPPSSRPVFRDAVGVDDDTWRRGHGWALLFGVLLLATSADNARYHQLGEHTLHEALADRTEL